MNIQAAVYESPHISVRKISQQVNASKTTVHVALRQHLGMYPFRASVTHQLLPHDFPARVFFCEWISEVLEYEPAFLERCFFSDEAWFHLDGFVNSQNFRQWSTDNPRRIIERPLHPQKIGVWSAMSSRRIFFLFFEQTVTGEVYRNFIHEFVATFSEEEVFSAWFQQDNAPAHTANATLKYLEEFFGERIISKGMWPARSPDLSPPDYFLWGYLKEQVYSNGPKNLAELRTNIANAITNISPIMLQKSLV
jgi:hypothetical protein